jgi:hypothetical protein
MPPVEAPRLAASRQPEHFDWRLPAGCQLVTLARYGRTVACCFVGTNDIQALAGEASIRGFVDRCPSQCFLRA